MSENAAGQPHVSVVPDASQELQSPVPEVPQKMTAAGGLRAKVREAREETMLERSPKALDDVVLRFRALSVDEYEHIGNARGVNKRTLTMETSLLTACDALAVTCVGVYIRESGDLVPALGLATAPTFSSPELAADLGVTHEGAQAADVVKALFPFDGDIIATSNAVLRFSGLLDDGRSEEISKVARGNS